MSVERGRRRLRGMGRVIEAELIYQVDRLALGVDAILQVFESLQRKWNKTRGEHLNAVAALEQRCVRQGRVA